MEAILVVIKCPGSELTNKNLGYLSFFIDFKAAIYPSGVLLLAMHIYFKELRWMTPNLIRHPYHMFDNFLI